jgi:hypothetical protein
MVQKPKKARIFAPCLLHRSFATCFEGFSTISRAQAAVEQKQGFMHPLNFYSVSSPHGENENIQHTGGGGI